LSTLFFYGTLRHIPLLEIVLGRPLAHEDMQEGRAEGYSVCAVKDADFPEIVFGGKGAAGIIVRGLSEVEVARLNFYEGGFDYALTPIEITTDTGAETAHVYFPVPGKLVTDGQWSFETWQQKWGALVCLTATEAMSFFGVKNHEELDFMFPMMRARAAAKLAAQSENYGQSPSGFTRADAKTHSITKRHTGFFALEEHEITHKTHGGGEISGIQREVFLGTDATILLPYDPSLDRVLLVEQFRAGPWVRNDNAPWMLEPVAGRIDAGETAEEAAHREAKEEANLTLRKLHSVAKVYASPGCTTDFFHIFVGETDLPDDIVGVAGLDTESEDIRSYLYSFDALMEMVDSFGAANAPLVLAALWLARRRDALRTVT